MRIVIDYTEEDFKNILGSSSDYLSLSDKEKQQLQKLPEVNLTMEAKRRLYTPTRELLRLTLKKIINSKLLKDE